MRKLLVAAFLSPLAASALADAAWAQAEPAAPLSGRTGALPPLSSRALPAAPSVHRLSIGPLSTPLGGGVLSEPGEAAPPPPGAERPPVGTLEKVGEAERLSASGPAASPGAPGPGAPGSGPDASDAGNFEALVLRARRGEAEANYRLGLRYIAGEGVGRDLIEAFARIRLAAESGHPRAVSLFYTLGAKLTAEEHGRAYERSQKLRRLK